MTLALAHEIRPSRESRVLPRWQRIWYVLERSSVRLFWQQSRWCRNFGKVGHLATSESMSMNDLDSWHNRKTGMKAVTNYCVTTLIIVLNQSWIHLLTKQTNQDLPHLNGLICFLTCSHVLCLCRIECNLSLFPAVPRNYYSPNTKDPSWCALPIRWNPHPICIGEALKLHSLYLSVPKPKLSSAFEVSQYMLCHFQYSLVGLTIAWLSLLTE